MKKDIKIPVVEGVYIALIKEAIAPDENKDDVQQDTEPKEWHAYLVNTNPLALEGIMIVSQGFKDDRKTSKFRHAFPLLKAHSTLKFEMIMPEVLTFENQFMLSFFMSAKLYDKKYVLTPEKINIEALEDIPYLEQKGILLQ